MSSLVVHSEIEHDDLGKYFFHYLQTEFPIDFIIFILLIIDVNGLLGEIPYFRLVFIIKLKATMKRVYFLEVALIENCYKEQYWELAKLFIFNYTFAHIVGLVLILVAKHSSGHNWLIEK